MTTEDIDAHCHEKKCKKGAKQTLMVLVLFFFSFFFSSSRGEHGANAANPPLERKLLWSCCWFCSFPLGHLRPFRSHEADLIWGGEGYFFFVYAFY